MRSVVQINSYILLIMSLVMLVPITIDIDHAKPFMAAALICFYLGGSLAFLTRSNEITELTLRQGFMLTASAWLTTSVFASIPFTFYGYSLADSFFETVSGLTTTGSTIMSDLDHQPHALLFWRSWLQWMGGIGMIVTSIALLPFLNVGGMQLFRTESSDRSDKELPRAASVAAATLWVYVALTALCVLAYFWGGMNFFDALNHALTTLSTGGYSTHDASMGYFKSPVITWTASLFMAAGGIPFVFYIQLIYAKKTRVATAQPKFFLYFLLTAISVISAWMIADHQFGVGDTVTYVTFNVISVVTTTGFGLVDYTTWGHFPTEAFFILTFAGGCSGSTAGGIKMMRFMVIGQMLRYQTRKLFYPNGVFVPRYDEKPLTDDVFSSVCSFFFIYFVSVFAVTLALQILGLDFTTSISGAATAISNVGPGVGEIIGPAGNFAPLPQAAKWILSFAMLLGRLEFMSLLVLLLPALWRKF